MEYDSKKPKMIKVGKIEMTRASFIVLLVGICTSVACLIIAPNLVGVIMAIYFLLSVILVAYNINCTQLGKCYTWAWILTVVYILGAVLSVIKIVKMKSNMNDMIKNFRNK